MLYTTTGLQWNLESIHILKECNSCRILRVAFIAGYTPVLHTALHNSAQSRERGKHILWITLPTPSTLTPALMLGTKY